MIPDTVVLGGTSYPIEWDEGDDEGPNFIVRTTADLGWEIIGFGNTRPEALTDLKAEYRKAKV